MYGSCGLLGSYLLIGIYQIRAKEIKRKKKKETLGKEKTYYISSIAVRVRRSLASKVVPLSPWNESSKSVLVDMPGGHYIT